jgi:hypothetical protein
VKIRPSIPLIMLVCALGASVAACGSSGSTSSSTPGSGASSTPPPAPSATTATSSAPATGGNAVAEITANWTAFFDPKTPVAKRVSLLQDGQLFASVIQAQANSTLASSASAKVTKVTVTSASQAAVTYSIVVGGTPALSGQHGTAVLVGGTWKVGLTSFCSLLTLEKSFGLSSSVPAACKAA